LWPELGGWGTSQDIPSSAFFLNSFIGSANKAISQLIENTSKFLQLKLNSQIFDFLIDGGRGIG
jgi:hypothetical protein